MNVKDRILFKRWNEHSKLAETKTYSNCEDIFPLELAKEIKDVFLNYSGEGPIELFDLVVKKVRSLNGPNPMYDVQIDMREFK